MQAAISSSAPHFRAAPPLAACPSWPAAPGAAGSRAADCGAGVCSVSRSRAAAALGCCSVVVVMLLLREDLSWGYRRPPSVDAIGRPDARVPLSVKGARRASEVG